MKANLIFPVLCVLLLAFGSCKKTDPTDAIVGTYVGYVHYVHEESSYMVFSVNIDTTYYTSFVVSKVSDGVFTITETPSFDFPGGTFQYSSDNTYKIHWYYTYGLNPGGQLQFNNPSSDCVTYNIIASDSEGGGSRMLVYWNRTFTGRKQ